MLCVQEKLSIKAREGFFSLVLYVQGLKKTQASKLGRKSSGGSSWKKKFSCGLSLVLLIVHALLPGSPHGRTWVDFFPFVVCKFVAMVMVGLAMAMGGFTIVRQWSSFLTVCSSCFCFSLLLSYSWLRSIVLLLLMVSLYRPLWSSSTAPHGRALLLLVVALCYSSLWSHYATFCGQALLLLVVMLYCSLWLSSIALKFEAFKSFVTIFFFLNNLKTNSTSISFVLDSRTWNI